MTTTFVGVGNAAGYYSGTATMHLQVPTAAQVGDLLVAVFCFTYNGAVAIPSCSGWDLAETTNTANCTVSVLTKTATAADLGSYTVFNDVTTTSDVGAMLAYRGQYSTPRKDASAILTTVEEGVKSITAPALDVPSSNDVVLQVFGNYANTPIAIIPATKRLYSSDTVAVADQVVVSEQTLSGYQAAAQTAGCDPNTTYQMYGTALTIAFTSDNPPNAIPFDFPDGSATLASNTAQTFSWTFSDNDYGDYQTNAEIQYWLLDGSGNRVGSATQVATGNGDQLYSFPANTFAGGVYEFQVRTTDYYGAVGPWGPSLFVGFATPPSSPSITAPANNSTVPQTTTLSWSASTQDSWEAQVLDGAGTVLASYEGDGTSYPGYLRSLDITFADNHVTRTLRLRVGYQGLWSDYASVSVNVSFTPPATPTLTTAFVDDAGFGFPYGFKVTENQPAPAAGEPTVTSVDVWVRESSDNTDATMLRIAAGIPPNTSVTWVAPRSGVLYEAMALTHADNGTTSESAWTPMPGPVELHGVILHSVTDPAGTIKFFKFNDAGATDTYTTESALIQYQGREYPVVEFGDAVSREISVPTIQAINGSTDADDLRALIALKTILCYRDRKGRKVFGVAPSSQIADMRGGETTSLDLTAVDYDEGV